VRFADRRGSAAATLWLGLRVDARRPATWATAVTGLIAGRWLAAGDGGRPLLPAAIACGGLLAVAAIGRLPRGVEAGGAWPGLLPLVWRAVWPMAGLLLGGGWAAWSGGSLGSWRPGVAAGVTTMTVLAAAVLGRRTTRTEAANASLLLGITAGAAGVALAVWAGGGGTAFQGLGGLSAWGLLAAALALDHRGDPRDWLGPVADRGVGPEAGHLVAMTGSLTAMIVCYFLAPQFAWAYAVLAIGLFVCLAVPPATAFGPATAGFVGSLAGRPPLPGTVSRAVRTAVVHAGILVWPAVIASGLPAAVGTRVGSPLTAIVWLGAVAGGLVATVAAATPSGRGDTARAALLAATAVAAAWAARGSSLLDCLPYAVFPGP
jgi:hypothetical protein